MSNKLFYPNGEKFLEDLFQAYFDARKNKRNTKSALVFELNFEENIFKLFNEIKNRNYEPQKSIAFVVLKPVKREVFAADFRDRVVHHLLFNYLNPIFEPTFINDSYSCRKSKGTLYGIRRAEHFMRSCSYNYQKKSFILKLDISGYFMSIDKELLYKMIEKELLKSPEKIEGDLETILYLLKKTIFSDPTKNYKLRGKKEDWKGLPKSKSLFYAQNGKGLPIGNLTSQLFGNIYLNYFDNFLKRKLKVKYYGRYVDDMIFFSTNKTELLEIKRVVENYLSKNLGLAIHKNKVYLQNIRKGFDFLGAKVRPHRTLAGKRLKGNFYKALYLYSKKLKVLFIKSSENVIKDLLLKIVSVFNSYLGMLCHFNSFNLRLKLGQQIKLLFEGRLRVDSLYTKVSLAGYREQK